MVTQIKLACVIKLNTIMERTTTAGEPLTNTAGENGKVIRIQDRGKIEYILYL